MFPCDIFMPTCNIIMSTCEIIMFPCDLDYVHVSCQHHSLACWHLVACKHINYVTCWQIILHTECMPRYQTIIKYGRIYMQSKFMQCMFDLKWQKSNILIIFTCKPSPIACAPFPRRWFQLRFRCFIVSLQPDKERKLCFISSVLQGIHQFIIIYFII